MLRYIVPLCLALSLFVGVPGQSSVSKDNQPVLSTFAQLAKDLTLIPCKNSDRLIAVKTLFQKLGLQDPDLYVKKVGGVNNFVINKQGLSEETIVLGAHYDKASPGCGAVDNWTGIVALAHIYRTLKDTTLNKSLVIVAFGKEEEGLLGSKAIVKNIRKEELERYCAMVNMDSLGLGAPQVATNLSSEKLAKLTAEIAATMNMPFGLNPVNGRSDSLPFLNKKIPAITLHGLSTGYEKIIHTSEDREGKIIPESVYLGYKLALAVAIELDKLPCNANR